MTAQVSPFARALGADLLRLPDELQAHFAPTQAVVRYRGRMHRCWRRGGWRRFLTEPFLRCAVLSDTLFPETGRDVPFELENRLVPLAGGRTGMTWTRRFRFGATQRRFHAVMEYDPVRRVIVDALGRNGHLEVDLEAHARGRALVIVSGRQRLSIGPLRIPLPRWLVGRAHVREWMEAPGRLGIRVTITNSLLGAFIGYRGSFRLEDPA